MNKTFWPFKRLVHRSASSAVQRIFTSHVIVSKSNDIYSNLALEDWIYTQAEKTGLGDEGLLLMWRNNPCVVVGRHQNIWVETDVRRCLTEGVAVARRRSGGGAVYHDRGNVNLTFFTDRKRYDRKKNLCLISAALNAQWNLQIVVNSRDDLLLDNKYKISGTAAKIGGKVAYHHCTLLLDTNLNNVRKYLRGVELGITTNATASVRASVKNLREVEPRISYEKILELMASMYSAQYDMKTSWSYVDPTDESLYPGIRELKSELEKWDWLYGHSPKFTVQRLLTRTVEGVAFDVSIAINIERGCIASASIYVTGYSVPDFVAQLCNDTSDSLKGIRFSQSDFLNWTERTGRFKEDARTELWKTAVTDCLQLILSNS